MNIHSVQASLRRRLSTGFEVYERRPGDYQLIVPISHEDGDMVDIYLRDSPRGKKLHTDLQFWHDAYAGLSYTLDITAPTRQQVFDSILINNGVKNDNGNLYLDAPMGKLYESILQFLQVAPRNLQHALLE